MKKIDTHKGGKRASNSTWVRWSGQTETEVGSKELLE